MRRKERQKKKRKRASVFGFTWHTIYTSLQICYAFNGLVLVNISLNFAFPFRNRHGAWRMEHGEWK